MSLVSGICGICGLVSEGNGLCWEACSRQRDRFRMWMQQQRQMLRLGDGVSEPWWRGSEASGLQRRCAPSIHPARVGRSWDDLWPKNDLAAI